MTDTNYPSATNHPHSQPPRGKSNKNLLIGLLAAGLLGTWGYLLWDKNKSSEKIQITQTQSDSYMSQRDSLKMMYDEAEIRLDSITGQNNNLQGKLTDREKEIDSKKSEIRKILNDKNATHAQLARARTLITELNEKINGLEAEVTRLSGENQELTATNTTLKMEKADLETNLQTTTTEKDELEKTVDVASTFSASNIAVTPVNEKRSGKEKSTTTAKKVDKLVVSFDVENRIARSGPADMYIIVTAPDGKVITDPALGSAVLNTRADGDKTFTSKVGVEYEQGTRKNIQLPIRQTNFQTGDYRIEIYHNGFKIGEGVRSLKKGGLFG
jgi:regulator of replication initiation timing